MNDSAHYLNKRRSRRCVGRLPDADHIRQYRRAGIGTNWNQNSERRVCKCLKTWWPGTALDSITLA
jgi:hypothetical protein